MINTYDKASYDSTPTNAVEFEDHRRQLLYKLLETDTMSGLTKVTMKVVSTPFQTTRVAARALTAATMGGPAVAISSPALDSLNQVMFRGRIEPGDGYLSPHYMLDDPCDVSTFRGDNSNY